MDGSAPPAFGCRSLTGCGARAAPASPRRPAPPRASPSPPPRPREPAPHGPLGGGQARGHQSYMPGRQLTARVQVVESLIGPIHRTNARAERRVEKELVGQLAAVAREPMAIARVVAGRIHYQLRRSYSHYYRRMLAPLLVALEFKCHNIAYRPVMDAIELPARYAGVDSGQRHYAPAETVSTDGVVPKAWCAGGLPAVALQWRRAHRAGVSCWRVVRVRVSEGWRPSACSRAWGCWCCRRMSSRRSRPTCWPTARTGSAICSRSGSARSSSSLKR